MFFSRHQSPYSLRKSRSILKSVYAWYKQRGHTLPAPQLDHFEKQMEELDQALLNKDRSKASQIAQKLEEFAKVNCKKPLWDYAFELAVALAFALVIATIVRQMWFEPYEIPTGSMRPTFKEQDHLTVTKTAFGINFPLKTKHLYFDPSLVQRTSIVIFSADGLPIEDTESTYFGILPYTKRYIKRLMGKPGDTFYFYGGQIYAVDKQGNEIQELRNSPWMKDLEHVPFLSFEGTLAPGDNTIFFEQFNQKIGKLSFTADGKIVGNIYNGKYWVKDNPAAQKTSHNKVETYSDFLGMRNYAMARLLTKKQVEEIPGLDVEGLGEGVLYLQLNHTPSLTYPAPLVRTDGRGANVWIKPYTTLIPLQMKHLNALMDHLYTARFVVKNGTARRYNMSDDRFPPGSPKLPGVPNGTYEFYFGKADQIHWLGMTTSVPAESPLYRRDPANIQLLFNLGIEMNMAYDPYKENQVLFPHRYAYFREGNLYVMGKSIMDKDDPILIAFNKREKEREAQSSAEHPYVAFKDYGPPMKEGKIDVEFLRTFGATIPEGEYLVLGDNHAMSSDSRVFGFVPADNLQGAPSLILWPPGHRWGAPPQKPYPILNLPRLIVWSIALAVLGLWIAYYRHKIKQPIFIKRQK